MPNDSYARVRRMFFDKNPAVRFLNKKTRKVLSKFGAYVRRSAQLSMRSSDKPAKPGEAPHARGKKLLKRMLFFSYDSTSKGTVVGPLRLQRTQDQHVPRVLEESGTIVRNGQVFRYKKFPYMKPAFDKNVGWVAAEYQKPA